jgi:hypothetical protein
MKVLRWVMANGSVEVREHDDLDDAVRSETWNDNNHALIGYEVVTDGRREWVPGDDQRCNEIERKQREEMIARWAVVPPVVAKVEVRAPFEVNHPGWVEVDSFTDIAKARLSEAEWSTILGPVRVRLITVGS